MKKYFFTPGPSQLFPTIPKHIKNAVDYNIPSISHRGQQFKQIFKNTVDSLKKLLNIPDTYYVFFLSSATEAMERIIENCVEKYSFHFVNGAFSKNFFQIAVNLKKTPSKVEVDYGSSFDFKSITIPENSEIICFTQNETSTGVALDPKNIYSFKKKYPSKLIAVDIVSSVPYINLDFNLCDYVFFSVQKGFGMPAGLGVLIVSPKALEKASYLKNKNINIGSYHNFLSLLKYQEKNQTPGTPNVLFIYLLGKIIDNLLKIGLKTIRKETEEKAKLLYDYLGHGPYLKPAVKDKNIRSKTVIVAEVYGGSKPLIKKLADMGFIIGGGYGVNKEKQIRIANFPAHSLAMFKKLKNNLDKLK